MGTKFENVRAASKTSIEITFTYQGQRCRERLKLKPSPINLKRAYGHLCSINDCILRSTFDYATTFPDSPKALKFVRTPGQVIRLDKYLSEWLASVKPVLKASTWDDYRKSVNNHLIPEFGDFALTELSRREVKLWAASLSVSNKRIGNLLTPLRQAISEAYEDELIDTNPLYGWNYRKREAPKTEDDIDPFTIDEQLTILNVTKGQAYNLIMFAFWTGMRPSEYIALNWGDVDWHREVVLVNKAITQKANEIEKPKTAAGNREVKLLPDALQALRNQKKFTFLADKEIFQNPRTLQTWTGDQPIRKTMWIPALKKAGVRYRYPYQMRHTYASRMLSAGENPMWVAKQMGHADWTMIARRYGKWIPEASPTSGSKAVEIFGSTKTR